MRCASVLLLFLCACTQRAAQVQGPGQDLDTAATREVVVRLFDRDGPIKVELLAR